MEHDEPGSSMPSEPSSKPKAKKKKFKPPFVSGSGISNKRFSSVRDPPRCRRTNLVIVSSIPPPMNKDATGEFRLLPFLKFALSSIGYTEGASLAQIAEFLMNYVPPAMAADDRFPGLLKMVAYKNAKKGIIVRRKGLWFLRARWLVMLPPVLETKTLDRICVGWSTVDVFELIAFYGTARVHIARRHLLLSGDIVNIHGRDVYTEADVRWHESNPATTYVVVDDSMEHAMALAEAYLALKDSGAGCPSSHEFTGAASSSSAYLSNSKRTDEGTIAGSEQQASDMDAPMENLAADGDALTSDEDKNDPSSGESSGDDGHFGDSDDEESSV